MADENPDQRLARIETSLEGIDSEIHKLTGLVTDALAEARKTRDEIRLLTGMVQGMATAGTALTEYVQSLSERVDRLENRSPKPE